MKERREWILENNFSLGMKLLFSLNAEGLVPPASNSNVEVKKSKAPLKSSLIFSLRNPKVHDMLWCDVFSAIWRGISENFTFETCILQFWEIVLNPFSDSFFPSIFSVFSCFRVDSTDDGFSASLYNLIFFSLLLSII